MNGIFSQFIILFNLIISGIVGSDERMKSSVFYTKTINLSTALNKQARLPCLIQKGRKFIWMQADRNEILAIDQMLMTSDRRFSIETASDCVENKHEANSIRTKKSTHAGSYTSDEFDTNDLNLLEENACWIHLVIENVNLSDEGLYVCQIDTMSSTRIGMNVLVPPYLNRKHTKHLVPHEESNIGDENSTRLLSTHLDLVEGNSIDLVCGASGRPEPQIKWFTFSHETAHSVYLRSNPILKLENLNRNSNKKYECIADNGVNPSLSRSFQINVQFSPVIKQFKIHNCSSITNDLIYKNNKLEIVCVTEANPAPSFKWFYNGTELNDKNLHRMVNPFLYSVGFNVEKNHNHATTLSLKNFSKNLIVDLFECVATNRVGSDKSVFPMCSEEFKNGLNKFNSKHYLHRKYQSNNQHKTVLNYKELNERKRTVIERAMKTNKTLFDMKMDFLSRQNEFTMNNSLRLFSKCTTYTFISFLVVFRLHL